jgi:hypothetical protein
MSNTKNIQRREEIVGNGKVLTNLQSVRRWNNDQLQAYVKSTDAGIYSKYVVAEIHRRAKRREKKNS